MHLAKLIKVLQALNAPQLKKLQKYAGSPFFGVYPPSVTLLGYLAPLYPGFAAKKITVAAIAKYHGSLSTLSRQETASTRLLRAIENFIAETEWQKNESEVKRYQLSGFKELGLTDEFDKLLAKEMKLAVQAKEQHVDTFFQKHVLTELRLNGFNAKLNRTRHNDIMPVIQTLDEYYALKKLRYLCEAINRKQVLGIPCSGQQIPELLTILEPYNREQCPYVYLFVQVYHMLSAQTYADCYVPYQLIKNFAARQNQVSQTLFEVMGYAVNCSLNWFNNGNLQAGDEYLWWVEWRLKNNLLLDKGQLLPITYRNIISMGVITGKNGPWLDQAIGLYTAYLPPDHYDTNFAFAQGLYQYVLGQYKKAIRYLLLAQAKEDAIFNSTIRRWQWICEYACDPNDTDTLSNQLQAFEKYLQRNQKQLQHLSAVFNRFIAYAGKLLKAGDTHLLQHTIEALQAEPHFAGKHWLTAALAAKNKTRTRGVQVLLP